MPKEFKSIGDILKNEPAFTNFVKAVKENDVAEKFSEIFPDLSKIAKAIKVKRNPVRISLVLNCFIVV